MPWAFPLMDVNWVGSPEHGLYQRERPLPSGQGHSRVSRDTCRQGLHPVTHLPWGTHTPDSHQTLKFPARTTQLTGAFPITRQTFCEAPRTEGENGTLGQEASRTVSSWTHPCAGRHGGAAGSTAPVGRAASHTLPEAASTVLHHSASEFLKLGNHSGPPTHLPMLGTPAMTSPA